MDRSRAGHPLTPPGPPSLDVAVGRYPEHPALERGLADHPLPARRRALARPPVGQARRRVLHGGAFMAFADTLGAVGTVANLPAGARTLLVTFEYDQTLMGGPPFAVTPDEVRALYSAGANVELLERADVLAENERFKARGLNALHENIFMLTCK